MNFSKTEVDCAVLINYLVLGKSFYSLSLQRGNRL